MKFPSRALGLVLLAAHALAAEADQNPGERLLEAASWGT